MRVKKIMPGSLRSFEARLKSGFYDGLALVAKDLSFVLDVSARRIDPVLIASQDAEHLKREADAWMRAHNPNCRDVGDGRLVADEAADSDRQSDFRDSDSGSKSIPKDHAMPSSRDENWSTIGEGDERPSEDDQDDSDGGRMTIGWDKLHDQTSVSYEHMAPDPPDSSRTSPLVPEPSDALGYDFHAATEALYKRGALSAERDNTSGDHILPDTQTQSSKSSGVKSRFQRKRWECCQCGGINTYQMDPTCNRFGRKGRCGHWPEGCAHCIVESS
jgi:hypothetical protein